MRADLNHPRTETQLCYMYALFNSLLKGPKPLVLFSSIVLKRMTFNLTFVLKSEYSIWFLLVQTMGNTDLFHVRHFVQSTSEPCFPS